jgi:hypothetical protein
MSTIDKKIIKKQLAKNKKIQKNKTKINKK